MRSNNRFGVFFLVALFALLVVLPDTALAYGGGSGGGEKDFGLGEVWTRIKEAISGLPGMIISLCMLITAIVAFFRQMFIPAFIITIIAFAVFSLPKIAESVSGLVF
jgi:ABC-type dipeptide/oligopeptide/nickel transport system permease subunit